METAKISFGDEEKKPLKIGSQEFISVNDFSLIQEETYKARRELSETEEKKIRCMQELRDKLKNDEEVSCRTDANYLLRYLRVRKYDWVKAYQTLKQVHSFKREHPEIFDIPPNLEALLNLNFMQYFPYTDEEGNVLICCNMEKWNHQERSFFEVFQASNVVCDIITMNPRCQVNGTIAIWNLKNVNQHHVSSVLSYFGIRNYSFYLQNLFPWRLKKIYLINTGRVSRLFFRMIRPLLSKKVSERIVLLGSDLKELHQYLNPALLPKFLGGNLEEEQCNITQNILGNISYIKYDRSFN